MTEREIERERLVELLDIIIQPGQKTLGDIADYLLANGVIVPPSEHVYFIVDKGTKYTMAMPKRTDELQLYKLRDLEKYGYYLSKEEAEKHL